MIMVIHYQGRKRGRLRILKVMRHWGQGRLLYESFWVKSIMSGIKGRWPWFCWCPVDGWTWLNYWEYQLQLAWFIHVHLPPALQSHKINCFRRKISGMAPTLPYGWPQICMTMVGPHAGHSVWIRLCSVIVTVGMFSAQYGEAETIHKSRCHVSHTLIHDQGCLYTQRSIIVVIPSVNINGNIGGSAWVDIDGCHMMQVMIMMMTVVTSEDTKPLTL